MVASLHADPVPLHIDETGTIRVGGSRITLDVVLADYKAGLSPEEIVQELDSLKLADVYAAIAYFHRHREDVELYLRQREAEADNLRAKIELATPGRAELKHRLTTRDAKRGSGDASTPRG